MKVKGLAQRSAGIPGCFIYVFGSDNNAAGYSALSTIIIIVICKNTDKNRPDP